MSSLIFVDVMLRRIFFPINKARQTNEPQSARHQPNRNENGTQNVMRLVWFDLLGNRSLSIMQMAHWMNYGKQSISRMVVLTKKSNLLSCKTEMKTRKIPAPHSFSFVLIRVFLPVVLCNWIELHLGSQWINGKWKEIGELNNQRRRVG